MRNADQSITRRDALAAAAVYIAGFHATGCTRDQTNSANGNAHSATSKSNSENGTERDLTMQVQYHEIVTEDVEAACELYSGVHGINFGDAIANLGGARTAELPGGGMMGIRAPMHAAEKSVARTYFLVEDIEAAVAAAEKSGATIALPPMEIPEYGTCAIFIHDGIEAGLWQL